MNARAAELINLLGLGPHPEGGYYREMHRSAKTVHYSGVTRSAMTSIYYLLAAGERSQWHRVASDEVWHFYEGAPLELTMASPDALQVRVHRLGPLTECSRPMYVVPAAHWQAAQPTGAYCLVGCTVGPGFDFDDFQLLRDLPEIEAPVRERLLDRHGRIAP